MENKICVILVNYNGKKYNDKCISSILKSTYMREMQILIVDNASTDGSLNELQEQWGSNQSVNIIPLEDNYGFSKANNVGIKWALEHGFYYLLLLNNDTEVEENAIERMIKQQEMEGGIVVPKILYADTPNILWCAGGFFTPIIKKAVQRGLGEEDKGQYDMNGKCSFANGCCMLLTSSIVNQLGFLDERFFLYYEDTEYSMRALNKGVTINYCSNAAIYHKVNGSTGGNSKPANAYYISRNWLLCNQQYMGKRFIWFKIYFYLNRLAWSLIWKIKGKDDMIRAMWKGIEDYKNGCTGKWNNVD